MWGTRKTSLLAACVVGAAALGGCTDPRAQGPTQVRMAQINAYMKMASEREDESSKRLLAITQMIDSQDRRRDDRLQRDVKRLEKSWNRDVKRWYGRQFRYRSDLKDMWDGDPDRADKMVPRMFY